MARLTDKQREDIKNQLILGESQYSIARDYEVSSATVNKIFKTITEDEFLTNEVKEEIAIKSKLSTQSKSLVKAFDDKVNDQLRLKNLVFKATEKIIKKATDILDSNKVVDKLNCGDGVQNFEPRELNTTDLKNLSDTIDKASITLGVNQRHSNSQINVNTQNNLENNTQNNITVQWE